MKRIKCMVAYDGTSFSGWQKQPGKRTVQTCIEEALKKIHKGDHISVVASGRTDASVHARGQVFHFDSFLSIPNEKWPKALNALLPGDIYVRKAVEVTTDFHARYGTTAKEYRYRIMAGEDFDLFRRHVVHYLPYSLDLSAMKEALSLLEGTHDFSSFCASNTDVVDKVRTIYETNIFAESDEIVIRLKGNGFLYNMVRIIVGTLIEIGQGKRDIEEMGHILAAQNRKKAGKTAPGHGLILWDVSYE